MATRFSEHQIGVLKSAFEESEYPTKEKKYELVLLTGLDMEQVTHWFNRQRVGKRLRESMGSLEKTNAELQHALRESQEREAELLNELQESRKRNAELHNELRQTKRRELDLRAENQQLQRGLTLGFEIDPFGNILSGALVPKRGNK